MSVEFCSALFISEEFYRQEKLFVPCNKNKFASNLILLEILTYNIGWTKNTEKYSGRKERSQNEIEWSKSAKTCTLKHINYFGG